MSRWFQLAANSWGTAWGERGLFRIRRGTNEADIETFVVGSWARLQRRRVAAARPSDAERRKTDQPAAVEEGKGVSMRGEADSLGAAREESDDIEASGDGLTDEPTMTTNTETERLGPLGSETTERLAASEVTSAERAATLESDLLSTEHLVEAESDKADDMVESETDQQVEYTEVKAGDADVWQTPESQLQQEESQGSEYTQLEQSITVETDFAAVLGGEPGGDTEAPTDSVPVSPDETTTDQPLTEGGHPGAGDFSDVTARDNTSPEEELEAEGGQDGSVTSTTATETQTEGSVTPADPDGDKEAVTTNKPVSFLDTFSAWLSG